ncbi:hypothetical protein NM688_g5635 [Phlebia brevispora]|uniref:Uncharacterized protein n=1 Tax=Phlebia brevispora TaxID=194682 RepID=A0ACC1SS87_9APHY|nr:hypothetical protein NM688_g5635 [Phlebia brevispora]
MQHDGRKFSPTHLHPPYTALLQSLMRRAFLPLSFASFTLWLGVSIGSGPPCPSYRPVEVCAQFINPYSYNAIQWENTCDLTPSLVSDPLVAYNAVTDLNASEPGCGYPGYYTPTCCASFGGPCNLGYDCDAQTTRPIPSLSEYPVLPSGWIELSECVIDNPAGSLLTDSVVFYGTALPYYCSALCDSNGYTYAGVEFGDQCWCGTGLIANYSDLPIGAPLAQCNWPCAEGFTLACGGFQRMQIYNKI